MNRTRTLTFATLTLIIAASFLVLTVQAATTETFTVKQSTYQVTFNLPVDTTFNGSVSTTSTVRVWVTDGNGSLITNLGLVDSTANFSFITTKEGNYYVNFENPLSSSASVTFTYQTDPDVTSSSAPILPFWLLPVFIAVTVAGCILIFYFSRRRKYVKR
jgi:hypothetical protein